MEPLPFPLSSRAYRISYFTALGRDHLCGSPQREPHAVDRSRNSRQEIRGSRGICGAPEPQTKALRVNSRIYPKRFVPHPPDRSLETPVVGLVKQFAERKNATAAQLSLAWLLARKPFIVPIPGTRNNRSPERKLGSCQFPAAPRDIREIDSAFSKIEVHGGRMNEEQRKVVDQTA
jgi:Aldo/keto reductase family